MRSLVGRLAQLTFSAFFISVVTFLLMSALPGNRAANRIGPLPGFTPSEREAIVAQLTKQLGLDEPLVVQYRKWLASLLQGDFGLSVQGVPVREILADRILPTLELGLAAAVLTVAGGVGFALLAYSTKRRLVSGAWQAAMASMMVTPAFWIGLLLIIVCAQWLAVLPASGYVQASASLRGWAEHLVLPAVTLAIPQSALLFRYVHAGLVDNSSKPFVIATRARGVSERRITYRSVLPNGILPSITIAGMLIGGMMSSLVIIESVFGWPGLGSLLIDSVGAKDFNVVSIIVILTALAYVVLAFGVDIAYQLIDPRLRRS